MLICVTNRKLCKDDFFNRIKQIALGKPQAIMLREKDLSLSEYEYLARKLKEICDVNQVPLIINRNITTAKKLKLSHIHLSMPDLRRYKSEVPHFVTGASVHSVLEANEAQQLGASYLIAGHIYSTDCKKGIPPRGLSFLKEVCESVTLPVYAIGGITKDKVQSVTKVGAKGFCIMSEAMTCPDPFALTNHFQV